jgi:hypothetical protein
MKKLVLVYRINVRYVYYGTAFESRLLHTYFFKLTF